MYTKDTNSVLSFRISSNLSKDLELMVSATNRSKAFLAQEAISQYLEANAWRVKELHERVKLAGQGRFVSHQKVVDWVDSFGEKTEVKKPKADVSLK